MELKKLDMSMYRPFREMGKTCRSREIREKKVLWPRFDVPSLMNGRFRVRTIGRGDLEKTAEFWRCSYPEIYGSNYGFLLYPEEIEKNVALVDNWEEDRIKKPHLVIVLEETSSEDFVSSAMLTKFDLNLEIEFSMVATHPKWRGKGLSRLIGVAVHDKIAESGAEYLTTFLETWHEITQKRLMFRGGWKIAGIFPGRFTRWKGGDQEYRGCVIYMYRFIGEGEEYATKPEEWILAPELKELWNCIERVNQKIAEKAEKVDFEKIKKLLIP